VGVALGGPRRGLVDPALPHVHAFLGLADQHHATAAVGGEGELVGAGYLLFGLTSTEPDHRQVVFGDEAVQVAHHPVVVMAEQRRRGKVALPDEPRPVQQELDQTPLVLQGGNETGHSDAIHAPHPQRHMLGQ
jgi:hypothetical protein